MANVKGKTQQDRLKAALRENLKRRKAQARGRQEASRDGAPGDETADAPKGGSE